ncbi:MAG: Do family serine endopeptidase [Deltaproteobacteria bacterium]|nr:Do family serine endopeptidase [Deltaproteobacteria bacterium]
MTTLHLARTSDPRRALARALVGPALAAAAAAGTLAAPVPARANAAAVVNPNAFSDVAEKAVRSVVNVATRVQVQPRGFERYLPGRRGQGGMAPGSLGSGVIVSKEGLVLTNNHVVAQGGDIELTLHDGRKLSATLVGRDPQSDVAVLRIDKVPGDLEPMAFADSDKVRLGEIVMAIGSPFGLAQTVTLGIISAKGRTNVGIVDYEDFIQTDASINPGNSGGALINARGELVGINTAIASRSGGSQGIGFAIPAKMAQRVMQSLVDTGTVERGWLGVMIQDLDPRLAEHFGLRDPRGVLVADVEPSSPAAQGGVRRGDVILAVDGNPVADTAKLRNRIAGLQPGAEPQLELWRDGKARRLKVKLGKAKSKAVAGPGRGAEAQAEAASDIGRWGLRLGALDDALRQRLRLPQQAAGTVILDVDSGSPADAAGLRPGDLVVAAGQREISAPDDLIGVLTGKRVPRSVALLVIRGGARRWVVLRR